jgi:hypothetical protein
VPDTTRSLNFQAIDVNELKKGWSYPLRKQTRVLQPSWSFSLLFPFLQHAWIMMFCLFAWVSIGDYLTINFLYIFLIKKCSIYSRSFKEKRLLVLVELSLTKLFKVFLFYSQAAHLKQESRRETHVL